MTWQSPPPPCEIPATGHGSCTLPGCGLAGGSQQSEAFFSLLHPPCLYPYPPPDLPALLSPAVFLSLCLFLFLSLSLSLFPSLSLSLSLSFSFPLSLSLFLSLSFSFPLSLSFCVSVLVCLFVCMFVCLFLSFFLLLRDCVYLRWNFELDQGEGARNSEKAMRGQAVVEVGVLQRVFFESSFLLKQAAAKVLNRLECAGRRSPCK